MSYEIAKSIKLNKKDNVIMLNIACNNIRPLHFVKWEFLRDSGLTFDQKMVLLFKDMVEGNVQPQCGKDAIDFAYACMRVNKDIADSGRDDYDIYKLCCSLVDYDHTEYGSKERFLSEIDAVKQAYGDLYDKWLVWIEERHADVTLTYDRLYSVRRLGKYNRGFHSFKYGSLGSGEKIPYKKAWIAIYTMSHYELSMAE